MKSLQSASALVAARQRDNRNLTGTHERDARWVEGRMIRLPIAIGFDRGNRP